MRRLLVTGGSGYLGTQLLQAAHGYERAHSYERFTTYFSHAVSLPNVHAHALDFHAAEAAYQTLCDLQPHVIIHTACSNRSAQQIDAIVPAAQAVARAAHTLGARLIHLSSDLVFDGENAPYHDDSPPTPIMPYGQAKAEAEAIVADLCPSAAIVRPSLIWGLDPLDSQTRWLINAVERAEPITLFTDEIRCPVHVHDLCAALLELAEKTAIRGPMNVVGPQALNRWDLGVKLLTALNLSVPASMRPGTVRDSGLVRARNLTLTTARAQRELATRLRGVEEALEQFPR